MIVVTGAAGFIGQALVQYLSARTSPVIGLSRADVDLTDAAKVRQVVGDLRPTTLVHLAASTARAEDDSSRLRQWRDTFLAGCHVFDALCAAGASHGVMLGSIDEIGPRSGVLEVDLPARPVSTYGIAKHLVREYVGCRLGGMPGPAPAVDWVRPFVVYGPGQRGEMLIPYAMRQALSGTAADVTEGRQRRDFLYIDDLVRYVARLVEGGPAATPFVVHHVGTGVATSVREALGLIEAHAHAVFRFGAKPMRGGEPEIQVAPTPTDPRVAGWHPETTLPQGIARTVAWWRRENAC